MMFYIFYFVQIPYFRYKNYTKKIDSLPIKIRYKI